jgi:beta-glucosidase
MNRRDFIRTIGISGAGLLSIPAFARKVFAANHLKASDFGKDFAWGVATAAYQIEGSWNKDGKGESIWDHFAHHSGKIKGHTNADVACDFYNRYPSDLALVKDLNFKDFRFSVSWARVLPEGAGRINQKGLDFYKRLTDECLSKGVVPWVCLYHWDLPQVLQEKGGWVNRDVIDWFNEFTNLITKTLGDRVKNWIILNEPMGFVGLGYMTGYHAPGEKGFSNFFRATHHALLCQAEGGRVVRNNVNAANIGTSVSCSWIDPVNQEPQNIQAAARLDALMNRLYIEPTLGLGYPVQTLPFLKGIEKHVLQGDEQKLKFDLDFIGIQNYFRVVGKKSIFPPFVWATDVPPVKRDVPLTGMKWEISPEGMYKILKQFAAYPVKSIIVTENGASFPDVFENGSIHDSARAEYFKAYLKNVLKAKQDGVNVKGYFAWTLMDNFEWVEGYSQRFGIIYDDFDTQKRIIKDSGYWFQKFLSE